MLKIENLRACIGEKPILKGIDLTVPQGEIHAIMGPNGSGKSTLGYVLSGRGDYAVTAGTARGPRRLPGFPGPGRVARREQRQLPAHRAECDPSCPWRA